MRAADEPAPGATAGGRLAYVAHGELDLLGELWAELPFRLSRRDLLFAGVDSRVALEQPSGFTFEVRDLQYRLTLGWRGRPAWAGGRALSAYLAQRGRENVDRPGQPWAQYLAFGAESAAFRERRTGVGSDEAPFDWRFAAGPVLDDREVEGDAVLEGEASWWLAALGFAQGAVALDVEFDALVADRIEPDFAVGPRVSWPVAGGRRASLYLHYEDSRNPLGSDESLWLVGFAYEEGALATGRELSPPQVDGHVSAGGGENRLAGELRLRFLFPPFLEVWHPVVWVDGNILTAEDTGDLYYMYEVGIERQAGPLIAGGWFFHRSNHELAEPNDRITSLNVLEAGIETATWHAPAGRSSRQLDGYAHAGWLLSDTFGEDRSWHLRAGARWILPVPGQWPKPYLLAEGEAGDVRRNAFAVGLAPIDDLELEVSYREDEQLFAADQTAVVLLARYGF